MIKVQLMPVYENVKSYYGKATIIHHSNKIQLQSYDTIVCELTESGKAVIFGTYSSTTLRHIKEFLRQYGYKVGTKKELEKLYMGGEN